MNINLFIVERLKGYAITGVQFKRVFEGSAIHPGRTIGIPNIRILITSIKNKLDYSLLPGWRGGIASVFGKVDQ